MKTWIGAGVFFLLVTFCAAAGLCAVEPVGDPVLRAREYAEQGRSYNMKGSYDQAIAEFDKAIALDSDCAEAYLQRGAAYGFKGDWGRGLEDFNRAIELYSKDTLYNPERLALAYYNRAIANNKEGNDDQAVQDNTRAIELYGKAARLNIGYLADAYNNQGQLLSKQGNHGQAIQDFDRAIELYGKVPDYHPERIAGAYCDRGRSYCAELNYRKGIMDYNRAIEIKPDHEPSYHNRGYAYYAIKDYSRAWDDLNKAHSLKSQVDPELLAEIKAKLDRSGGEYVYDASGSVPKGLYALDSAIDFNVLDSVRFDPKTGQIMLAGHRDERYQGAPIPYLDYLAELLKNPSPEFTLNWTPESEQRVRALFRDFDSDAYVKGLVGQWTDIMDENGHPTGPGRWLLELIGIRPTLSGGRIGYLGVDVQEITQRFRNVYERLEIVSVVPGSAAERAGLRPGYVITNYANMEEFSRSIKRIGEGGKLMLQISRDGGKTTDLELHYVTLDGREGDPWAELDNFDIVQKMLSAAGNEKGFMLLNSFGEVQRLFKSKIQGRSVAGFGKAFSILVAVADYNDGHWQNDAELREGRISENELFVRAYHAIFAAMDKAFEFGDQPLTNTFDSAVQSGLDAGGAYDRTVMVFNERIGPYLERVLGTLLVKNDEVQIPPDVFMKSVGKRVEVRPEYRGADPRSALARLFYSADYIGKTLLNMPSLTEKIPRYQTDFGFERNNPDKAGPWRNAADYHLWYSIGGFDLAESADGNTLYTRGAKMRFNIREKAPEGGDLPAVPGGYEELLTSLYDDLAVEFPVLHELREAAKISVAARWLKSKKPDLKLPDAGRVYGSVPDRAPGFVFLTCSFVERPGRLAAALSAVGGVTFDRKISGLDLVRAPEGFVGPAEDGLSPVVDLSRSPLAFPPANENPGLIAKLTDTPDNVPVPQPLGWAATGKEGEKDVSVVAFMPTKGTDSAALV